MNFLKIHMLCALFCTLTINNGYSSNIDIKFLDSIEGIYFNFTKPKNTLNSLPQNYKNRLMKIYEKNPKLIERKYKRIWNLLNKIKSQNNSKLKNNKSNITKIKTNTILSERNFEDNKNSEHEYNSNKTDNMNLSIIKEEIQKNEDDINIDNNETNFSNNESEYIDEIQIVASERPENGVQYFDGFEVQGKQKPANEMETIDKTQNGNIKNRGLLFQNILNNRVLINRCNELIKQNKELVNNLQEYENLDYFNIGLDIISNLTIDYNTNSEFVNELLKYGKYTINNLYYMNTKIFGENRKLNKTNVELEKINKKLEQKLQKYEELNNWKSINKIDEIQISTNERNRR